MQRKHPAQGETVAANHGQKTPHNKRQADRVQFIEWLALPRHLRRPGTQEELAAMMKVAPATFSHWKRELGFLAAVRDRANEIARESHAEVIGALLANIRAGDTRAIQIYFDYIQEMKPKEKIEAEVREVRTPDEIRARIAERLATLGYVITRRR